eukprot:scaffold6678_cov336-Prasinococcus_capsulatus_cf.AAC.7
MQRAAQRRAVKAQRDPRLPRRTRWPPFGLPRHQGAAAKQPIGQLPGGVVRAQAEQAARGPRREAMHSEALQHVLIGVVGEHQVADLERALVLNHHRAVRERGDKVQL